MGIDYHRQTKKDESLQKRKSSSFFIRLLMFLLEIDHKVS